MLKFLLMRKAQIKKAIEKLQKSARLCENGSGGVDLSGDLHVIGIECTSDVPVAKAPPTPGT